jgi:tRNA (guanine26-N2/guanine27-N2)-dimethyltransferase
VERPDLPHYRHVIANDISPDAIAAMRRNVDINGLAPPSHSQSPSEQPNPIKDLRDSAGPSAEPRKPAVTVNEGDATCAICCWSFFLS